MLADESVCVCIYSWVWWLNFIQTRHLDGSTSLSRETLQCLFVEGQRSLEINHWSNYDNEVECRISKWETWMSADNGTKIILNVEKHLYCFLWRDRCKSQILSRQQSKLKNPACNYDIKCSHLKHSVARSHLA